MESFITELKKKTECTLCNDTLVEPKMLPCFHTFCKLCIKRHAEMIDDIHALIKCPQCSTEMFLPDLSTVEDLQPSPLHSRILNGLSLLEKVKFCSISGSHPPASWYCFDCEHSLCQECEKNHSYFTKSHNIICTDELRKEDIEQIITRENHCTSHQTQRLELFCEDCDRLICLTCWKHGHKDHKTMSLENFTKVKKSVLSKHLQALEYLRHDEVEKQLQENMANIIKQQGEEARKEVQDKTMKIIQTLQENERELLRRIDDKMYTATQNLNIIHHIPAVKEYINNLIERGLASEMINIQETECSEKFIFSPILLSSRNVFVPNDELMQQVKSGLGKIQSYSETDHTISSIHVQSETEALRKQKLILMTKTSTGDDSTNAGDIVDVQINPEDDVKIEESYARSGGKIEIEFMPKVPGQLTAEVKVNGNQVSNSPLVMNVKPQQMRITWQFYMKGINAELRRLTGIAVNRDNSKIAVADCSNHCVHVFNTDGDLVLTYGTHGSKEGELSCPEGLAFLDDTNLVIADWGNHRICVVDTTTGILVKTFGNQGNGNGEFYSPIGVHVDDEGNIIVGDNGNHRVQVFTRDGDYQYQFGFTEQEKFHPVSAVKYHGMFYTSDYNNNNIVRVFEKKGDAPTRITTIGGQGSAAGQLSRPLFLAVDNDHNLVVCDRGNNRLQKFTADGLFMGKTCDEIKDPVSLAVLNDGQLLVTTSTSGVWFVK